MTKRFLRRSLVRLALPVVFALAISGQVSVAAAQPQSTGYGVIVPAKLRPAVSAGRYVVEFRARDNSLTGHSYVVIERPASGGGERLAVFGFYPSGGAGGAVQSLIGVEGVVGTSRFDRADIVTVRRRFEVDFNTLRRIMAVARGWRGRTFDLFATNCNAFVADIAHAAGVRAPGNTTQLPVDFVVQLRRGAEESGASTQMAAFKPDHATTAAAGFTADHNQHRGNWSYGDDALDR